MSRPGFPSPPPGWGAPAPDPGPIPLRPLTVGDLLGTGFGVVRRHLALLGSVAVLVAALSAGAMLGILAGSGTLQDYVTTPWLDDLTGALQSGGEVSVPAGMYLAAGASLLITVTGTIVVSAFAAACAGVDAMGRQSVRGALTERLAGRVGSLLATSLAVGVATVIGLTLFVVPGVLVYVTWAAAAPAAAMERSGVGASLRRSVRLTRGHRGRILGMTVLILLVAYVIESVVSSVVLAAAGTLTPMATLVVTDAVTVVVASVTTSWVGAVIALLYIDIRVRTENLGPALRAFAAADRARGASGPALGGA